MVMAQIYIDCGEYDAAFDELDYLLSLETYFTVNSLKLDRRWDDLRDLPRYQELLKKYPYNPETAVSSLN
jgi:hypothetical protein